MSDKVGRPTKYNEEVAEKICEAISTSGVGLNSLCKELGVSAPTVHRWLRENEEFRVSYMRAREAQADFYFEEIYEIANHVEEDHTPFTGGNVVQRDRLRIDSLKWIASKLAPKKYGDKLDVTSNGETIAVPTINIHPKE